MKLNRDKLFYDSKGTFGKLLFMGKDSDGFKRDEDGNQTGELVRRNYNFLSERQGEIVRVAIPVEAGEKTFAMKEEVELVDVQISSIVDTSGYRPQKTYYITAQDVVKVGASKPQQPQQPPKGQPQGEHKQ